MILTYKREIQLNKKQLKYYNDSLSVFNALSKAIYATYQNKKPIFDPSYYLRLPSIKKVDRFAIVDRIIEHRNEYEQSYNLEIKNYDRYEVTNPRFNIVREETCVYIFGFGYISTSDLNDNIPRNSKIYKIMIKKVKNIYYSYIYFVVKDIPEPINTIKNSIGLDYSIKDFYVASNKERCGFPDLSKYRNRIKMLQKELLNHEKGSSNYNKIKAKIGNTYKKMVSTKSAFLHKESTRLVKKYDLIAVETLDLKQLCKRGYIDRNGLWHRYGKEIYLTSYNQFVDMLAYKSKLKGKIFIKVSKFFPSSKKCSYCGELNNLSIDIRNRILTCPTCGKQYDRDENAAINILNEGIRKYKEQIK